MTSQKEIINGQECIRDNLTGLYSKTIVANLISNDEDFEKEVPAGYCLVDAIQTASDPHDDLKDSETRWIVTFGTFGQVAALIPDYKFVPAETVA